MNYINDVPIVISKGTPYEIGFSHGTKARDRIKKSLQYNLATCVRKGSFTLDDARDMAMQFVKPVQEYQPDYIEEIRGIAEGSDNTFQDIMLLNCRTEIQKYLAWKDKNKKIKPEFADTESESCTVIAVTGERSKNGDTYIAQNWDNRTWARECLIFHVIHQDNGRPSIAYIGEAGIISRFGMNSAGIGSGCNSLYSNSPVDMNGVPLQFLIRGILDSTDLCMAVDACNCGQNAAVNNMLIAYKDGEAADVEMDYQCAGLLYPENGALTHANMYVSPGHPRYPYVDTSKANAFFRHYRTRKLIQSIDKISSEDIEKVLSDHCNKPQSICRHGEPWLPEEKRAVTVFSYICDLNDLSMRLAIGCPCGGYQTIYPFSFQQ